MNSPLVIDYYSDVLCVWAWIAQRRNEELHAQWMQQIDVRHHYLNLFGNTTIRIGENWEGGFETFAAHVIDAASPYDNAPVNQNIWRTCKPKTSHNAHLILKAVEIIAGAKISHSLAAILRHDFFTNLTDISSLENVLAIASSLDIDITEIRKSITTGQAAAALMRDYQIAQEQNIKGSPSWVMDGGRQTLYGNVGYRVLHANVEELLRTPGNEVSWC